MPLQALIQIKKRPSATACTEAFAVAQALPSFEAEPNKGRKVKDTIWKYLYPSKTLFQPQPVFSSRYSDHGSGQTAIAPGGVREKRKARGPFFSPHGTRGMVRHGNPPIH
ncbi:MAG: hypothetical protein ACOCZL_04665 [Bacteroidota bacterium]